MTTTVKITIDSKTKPGVWHTTFGMGDASTWNETKACVSSRDALLFVLGRMQSGGDPISYDVDVDGVGERCDTPDAVRVGLAKMLGLRGRSW